MIPCISVENMRLSDAYTIANFVPSLKLMHRAAMGVFKAVKWSGSTAITDKDTLVEIVDEEIRAFIESELVLAIINTYDPFRMPNETTNDQTK